MLESLRMIMVEMFNWRICYIFPVFRLLLLVSFSGPAKTFGEQSKTRSKQVAISKYHFPVLPFEQKPIWKEGSGTQLISSGLWPPQCGWSSLKLSSRRAPCRRICRSTPSTFPPADNHLYSFIPFIHQPNPTLLTSPGGDGWTSACVKTIHRHPKPHWITDHHDHDDQEDVDEVLNHDRHWPPVREQHLSSTSYLIKPHSYVHSL